MRKPLTPEQTKELVSEVKAWMQATVAGIVEDEAERKARWQTAQIDRIEQFIEIDEIECYLVFIRFFDATTSNFYITAYPFKRYTNGVHSLISLTYFAPDFTHPAQQEN